MSRDLIHLMNLRKRLWERLRTGDADHDISALIAEIQTLTDKLLQKERKT